VLLQADTEKVDSTRQSLKLIQYEEKKVISYKETIIALLKQTDINFLGATLPPPPPDRTPVFFDAVERYWLLLVTYHFCQDISMKIVWRN
jgi:hypothetical protein